MARLNDGDNVITVLLPRICPVRNCQIGNNVKVVPVEEA
jgi:conserved domain protein